MPHKNSIANGSEFDITNLAISLIEKRLTDAFPGVKFAVHGTPKGSRRSASPGTEGTHEFQLWAVSLVLAIPFKGGKKGADSGIDGYLLQAGRQNHRESDRFCQRRR